MSHGFFELQGHTHRYRVLEDVGYDATASFHLVSVDGRQFYVLRRLREDVAHNPDARAAFLHNAHIALRLPPHPAVIPTVDLGDLATEPPFLVEEFVGGETFESLRVASENGHPLSWQAAASAVAAAAHAVDHLYGRLRVEISPHAGFSVFPEMISVTAHGAVRIADAAGDLRGRPAPNFGYGAPEQWNSPRPTFDERGLVFALATILWELCTGYRLFQAETPADAQALFRAPRVEPLGPSFPGIPEGLDTLLQQAFSVDPRNRQARPRDLAVQLEALVPDGRGLLALHMASHFAQAQRAEHDRLSAHAVALGAPPLVAAPLPIAAPAHGHFSDDEKTGYFEPRSVPRPMTSSARPQFDDEDKTGFFDPAVRRSVAADDDEKTGFFEPSKAGPLPAAPVPAPPAPAPPRPGAGRPATQAMSGIPMRSPSPPQPEKAGGADEDKTGFFDTGARLGGSALAQPAQPQAHAQQSVDARPPPASHRPAPEPSARVLVDDAPAANAGSDPNRATVGFMMPISTAPPLPVGDDVPFYQPGGASFPAAPAPPAPAPPPPGFPPATPPPPPFVGAPPPPFPEQPYPGQAAFPGQPYPGQAPFPGQPYPVPGFPPAYEGSGIPAIPGAPGLPAMPAQSAESGTKKKKEIAIFAAIVVICLIGLFGFMRRQQAKQAALAAEEAQEAAIALSASMAQAAPPPVPTPTQPQVAPAPVPTPVESTPAPSAPSAPPVPTATAPTPPVPTAVPAPTTRPTATAAPTATATKTIPVPAPTKTVPVPTAAPTSRPSGSGFVSVLTSPACDNVTMDGKNLGGCPAFKKAASAGTHTFRIKTGGVVRTVTATVEAGQTTFVR